MYIKSNEGNDYNARMYDPSLGRFLSVDPMISHPGSTQSINPYSYVENNPLNKVDPTRETVTNDACLTEGCKAISESGGEGFGGADTKVKINLGGGKSISGTLKQLGGLTGKEADKLASTLGIGNYKVGANGNLSIAGTNTTADSTRNNSNTHQISDQKPSGSETAGGRNSKQIAARNAMMKKYGSVIHYGGINIDADVLKKRGQVSHANMGLALF